LCHVPFNDAEETTEVGDAFSIKTSSAREWKWIASSPGLFKEQMERVLSPAFIEKAVWGWATTPSAVDTSSDGTAGSQTQGDKRSAGDPHEGDLDDEDSKDIIEMGQQLKYATETDVTGEKGVVLNAWDFAGQEIYYALHHVFIRSNNAVFIVVFNLEEASQEDKRPEVLRNLLHWLNSIHTYSIQVSNLLPTAESEDSENIILVGAHKDKLIPEQKDMVLAEIDEALEEAFSRLDWYSRLRFLQYPLGSRIFFAVSNKYSSEDVELPILRQAIMHTASSMPSIRESRPIRWVKLNEKMRLWKHSGSDLMAEPGEVITYSEARKVARRINGRQGLITDQELQTALVFLNNAGELLYIDDLVTPEEQDDNLVVLSFAWLARLVKMILPRKGKAPFRKTRRPSECQRQRPHMMQQDWVEMWEDFINQGKLHQDLLQFDLWADVPATTRSMLLRLLDRLDILCLVSTGSESVYLVPSVPLYYRIDRKNRPLEPPASIKTTVPFAFFTFSGFLPEGLFSRLLIQAVKEGACRILNIWYRTAGLAMELPGAKKAISIQLISQPESLRIALIRVGALQQTPSMAEEETAEGALVIYESLACMCEKWYVKAKPELKVGCPEDESHFFDVHKDILFGNRPHRFITKNGSEIDADRFECWWKAQYPCPNPCGE